MSARQIRKRIAELEGKAYAQGAVRRAGTLEEHCRRYWRQDRDGFKEMAAGNGYRVFVEMFEREDAERARRSHGEGHPPKDS